MKKVFAVLLISLTLSSCSIPTFSKNKTNPNLLYSCVGDFDGDSRIDSIMLVKNNNSVEIIFKSKFKTKRQSIEINFDNFYCSVEDINDDKCDDFIINTIENNKENIYIFTFKNDIKELLSPQIIKQQINLYRDGNKYTIACGGFNSTIKSQEQLSLNLLYSTSDYTEYGKSIITEGVLVNDKSNPKFTVSIIYKLNSLGKLNFMNISVTPYVHVEVPR